MGLSLCSLCIWSPVYHANTGTHLLEEQLVPKEIMVKVISELAKNPWTFRPKPMKWDRTGMMFLGHYPDDEFESESESVCGIADESFVDDPVFNYSDIYLVVSHCIPMPSASFQLIF